MQGADFCTGESQTVGYRLAETRLRPEVWEVPTNKPPQQTFPQIAGVRIFKHLLLTPLSRGAT